jgi:hypothetical protein
VSNGIGGLVSVTRKRPVFVDFAPTAAASPSPAFAAVAELVSRWRRDHGQGQVTPVVLHLTRGRFTPETIAEAVGSLGPRGDYTLYHLVVTESPHAAVAYPADAAKIGDAALAKLCELSSLLLGGEALAARKATVAAESRGMVVNGKFDLFWEGIEEALKRMQTEPPDADGKPS